MISGEHGNDGELYAAYRDTCQFVTYLTTCGLDRIWVMCGPSVTIGDAFVNPREEFYMRFGEHFRDRGQEVQAQVAELKQTIFQPGDTVVVYIRSHGDADEGEFYGPVPRSRLWKYDDVIDMLFGKKKMKGVTFCFFADACHSGWFAKYCEDHEKMFEGNSVIVYTSCAADETTPRGDPLPSGAKIGRGITCLLWRLCRFSMAVWITRSQTLEISSSRGCRLRPRFMSRHLPLTVIVLFTFQGY